ncbi:MAG: hypothetical protein A2100_02380 [Sideroxydans sp. GWF2_59_14]|nr:MAG: hypothetical protein A2100_02380 [Sideroxydans sp. GWF2_59_14]HAF45178.1 hypothetical protein [Gallionellaceae bacterium]
MKVSIQEYLRQYFIQEHGIDQADAALLILDPEFGVAIEPYFLAAVEEMVEFELPITKVSKQEVLANIHGFCDGWIGKYDDQRRLRIQEYLSSNFHPAANVLANSRMHTIETPTHIKILSFAFWGGIILLILWIFN